MTAAATVDAVRSSGVVVTDYAHRHARCGTAHDTLTGCPQSIRYETPRRDPFGRFADDFAYEAHSRDFCSCIECVPSNEVSTQEPNGWGVTIRFHGPGQVEVGSQTFDPVEDAIADGYLDDTPEARARFLGARVECLDFARAIVRQAGDAWDYAELREALIHLGVPRGDL